LLISCRRKGKEKACQRGEKKINRETRKKREWSVAVRFPFPGEKKRKNEEVSLASPKELDWRGGRKGGEKKKKRRKD